MLRHGDLATCKHCNEVICYWNGNMGNEGAFWFHYGIEPQPDGGNQPQYCSQVKAEPKTN